MFEAHCVVLCYRPQIFFNQPLYHMAFFSDSKILALTSFQQLGYSELIRWAYILAFNWYPSSSGIDEKKVGKTIDFMVFFLLKVLKKVKENWANQSLHHICHKSCGNKLISWIFYYFIFNSSVSTIFAVNLFCCLHFHFR